ncbi:MAG: hypothetical protein KBD01_01530 [Acidobacteria bacterium]|nr:hypothetical protein [Acidobacteriota bacterium]
MPFLTGAPARAQVPDEALEPPFEDLSNPLEAQRAASVLAGLEERTRVVQEILADAARAYRQTAMERAAAQQELNTAEEALDRESVRPREATAQRLDELQKEALQARARAQATREQLDARLADLRRLLQERDALARRIAEVRARLPEHRELLTGVWEVSWMPAGTTGTFYLDQSGTLVTGQYRLGINGSGSLQGTFVGGKLFLQRIDAQRGRDAELEGLLDPDGSRLRGTWQAYELVQGGLPRGQWVARRTK